MSPLIDPTFFWYVGNKTINQKNGGAIYQKKKGKQLKLIHDISERGVSNTDLI